MWNLVLQSVAVVVLGFLAGCAGSAAQGGGGGGFGLKAGKTTVESGGTVQLAATLNGQPVAVEFALNPDFTRVETPSGKVELLSASTGRYSAPRTSSGFVVRIYARLLAQKNQVQTLDLMVLGMTGLGGKLSYTTGAAIWEVDLSTGVSNKLNPTGQDAWFASGRYWYVDIGTRGGVSQDPGPSLFRLDGSGVQEYLHYSALSFASDLFQPRVNPTGDLVTFDMLGTDPKTGESGHFVHIYPSADSVKVEDVLRSFAGFERAAWLPVTPAAIVGRLVMMTFSNAVEPAGIYITDDKLANPTYLAWDDSKFGIPKQAEPSPDGKQMAIVTDIGNLYLADFDGTKLGNVRRLVESKNTFKAGRPTWSPDGKWLAYYFGATRQQDILIQSAQGSAPMSIITDIGGGIKAPLSGLAFYQLSWN